MSQPRPTPADIERAIRNIPDFPKPGIQFKDITPMLADARLFSGSIDLLTEKFKPGGVDAVVGIDARGFIRWPVETGPTSNPVYIRNPSDSAP